MNGVLMLADPAWFAYHERNSIGRRAVFYASPNKRTNVEHLDPLFCVRPGSTPRSIVGVGRIHAQRVVDQDAMWSIYQSALGADTEADWRSQASSVLENSRRTYEGKILAVELVDFQPFTAPVSPESVGLDDAGWRDRKKAGEEATRHLLKRLSRDSLNAPPVEPPEVAQLREDLGTLQSAGRPQTPETLQRVQRVLEAYERPSSITRYVKRTRGATCQLCGALGFVKRNGELYCEVHHLFHLSRNPPPACLGPEFLVLLCATCHRRMHYADVSEPVRDEGGWRVRVDDKEHLFVVT